MDVNSPPIHQRAMKTEAELERINAAEFDHWR